MASVQDDDHCTTCGKPRDNHPYRHAFTSRRSPSTSLRPVEDVQLPNDASSAPARPSQGAIGSAMRGDPVLRIALIRAGVITVADIEAVEAELRVSGYAEATPPRPLG